MKKTKKLHNTKSVLFSFNDTILIYQINIKKDKTICFHYDTFNMFKKNRSAVKMEFFVQIVCISVVCHDRT